jgi:transglutaminase/protease-like cytokinesis protein 3
MTRLVFEKLRKDRSTVCTGYAYLLRELSSVAGIRCEIINGYGRNATANIGGEGVINHSWNAIQLQGKWYLCDVTWSSGAIDMEKQSFVKHYDDTYFLLEPVLFIRNHYPQDTSWILSGPKPTLTDFLNRPLVYVSALTLGIHKFTPETFEISAVTGEPLTIHFQSDQKIVSDVAVLQITRSGAMDEFVAPLTTDNDGYSFRHTFKSSGVYVVQVKLNDNYVFCYRVTIPKSK